MPFDPTYPPANAEIQSTPLRAQFQSLNQDIQARATVVQMTNADNAVLQQTSANSNNVEPIDFSADENYNPAQLQAIIDAFNTLVNSLRR